MIGAWLPWHVVEQLAWINLRRPSSWRVFLAILTTSTRYGGRDALLGIDDLAGMTGLSTRTVKGALAELRAAGLVVRTGRTRRLFVPLLAAGPPERADATRPAFTRRQERAVARTLAPAPDLGGGRPTPRRIEPIGAICPLVRCSSHHRRVDRAEDRPNSGVDSGS